MPDPLHWLGVTRIHRFISMSDMKVGQHVLTYASSRACGLVVSTHVLKPSLPSSRACCLLGGQYARTQAPPPSPRLVLVVDRWRDHQVYSSIYLYLYSNTIPTPHTSKKHQYEAITKSGITIDERVPIPPELVPKDAAVEISAKVSQ